MANDLKKVGDLLILIGGILGLLFGILFVLNLGAWISFLPGLDLAFLGAIVNIIQGAILIVLSLIVLATSGTIDISKLKMSNNWVVHLILGIVMYIFGGGIAAILVIIGAILLALS